MKKSKIIIVGADFKWEEEQLLQSAKNTGIEAEFILLGDIEVHLNHKAEFWVCGKDLFRSLDGSEKFVIRRSRGNFEKLCALTALLEKRKFHFTDSFRAVSTNLNKEIALPIIESEIFPAPPNTFFLEPYKENFQAKLSFPNITKPVQGRHGEGISINKTEEDFDKSLKEAKENLIVQDFLDIDFECRIFVVGDRALGAVKKIPEEGKQVANYAAGAQFIPMDLPPEFLVEAVRLCKTEGIDIGGVDVAKIKGGEHYYLLEINRCPEFKAFSRATGINVAEEIIEFVVNG